MGFNRRSQGLFTEKAVFLPRAEGLFGGRGLGMAAKKGGFFMATIQPKGEKIRQAVRWISDERLEDENKDFSALISKAGMKFNLSPAEEDYLRTFYKEKNK